MLKITIYEDDSSITLKIEGKLIGPWIDEFSEVWEQTTPLIEAKNVRLDIRDMTFIDGDGIEALRKGRRWHPNEVIADTPLTRDFSDRITGSVAVRNVKEIEPCNAPIDRTN
ncbi:hypothetical protein [Silvibacterium acidisoli]|uniref:hypothetical protein n=1 Tax=Acidobacteriaceae bacterium ZG23-2 TaxID=2883246 RepID=UPI00406BF27A